MLFSSANAPENIDIAAVNGRVRFWRDVANVTMDLNDVETIEFNAMGGADNVVVNRLVGTDLTQLNLNLAAVGGGGDTQPDSVVINGGDGADAIQISGDAGDLAVAVNGLTINMSGHEPANDSLTVCPLGGADTVTLNTIVGITGMAMSVNLAAAPGSSNGDAQPDQMSVNFNLAADTVGVSDSLTGTHITGLSPNLVVSNADLTGDSLRLNTGGGVDAITVNQAGTIGAVRNVLISAGTETDTITVANTAADGAATIIPSTGNDTVSVNMDGQFLASAVFAGTQRIGALSLSAGGRATLAAGSDMVLTMSSLSLTSTGRLDLTDGNAIIDYSGATPFSTIRSRVISGYAAGAWNGAGVISSTAASAPGAGTGVGYAEATDLFTAFPTTFKGQSIDNTAIVLSHARYGDANLDGIVNLGDFNRLAANFGQTNRNWVHGDFDYNGTVTLSDFNRLASNFGQASAAPGGVANDDDADPLQLA
jgi:hypothetical protein